MEKKLIPTRTVKYLEIILDQHQEWPTHMSQVEMKLSRAIGVLSKLRHKANVNIFKMVYHFLAHVNKEI